VASGFLSTHPHTPSFPFPLSGTFLLHLNTKLIPLPPCLRHTDSDEEDRELHDFQYDMTSIAPAPYLPPAPPSKRDRRGSAAAGKQSATAFPTGPLAQPVVGPSTGTRTKKAASRTGTPALAPPPLTTRSKTEELKASTLATSILPSTPVPSPSHPSAPGTPSVVISPAPLTGHSP
jgi:hypothetical protein